MKLFGKIYKKCALILSLLLISRSAAFASENDYDPLSAEKGDPVITYTNIDILPYANAKFFIDPTNTSECISSNYQGTDFVFGDLRMAAVWPMAFRTGSQREGNGTYGKYYPEQQAAISVEGSKAFITSKKSNVPYCINKLDLGSKEIIVLNKYFSDAKKESYIKEISLDTKNESYDKIFFLVASAVKPDQDGVTVSAAVTYTDETTDSLSGAIVPASSYDGQISENFVADIDRVGDDGTSYTLAAVKADSRSRAVSLYEYFVELDSSKTVDKIYFTTDRPSGVITNVGIVSVVGLKNWRKAINETEAAISGAVADPDNIDKVLQAVKMVNDIKASGLQIEDYVENYGDYAALFSDAATIGNKLLSQLVENKPITWDSSEEFLSQAEGIVTALEAIGCTYDSLDDETKQLCEKAVSEITETLLNSDKEREKLEKRLEVLKNVKIEAFKRVINERLLWIEKCDIDVSAEVIQYKLNFSQPISSEDVCHKNFKVLLTDKQIDDSLVWFTYDEGKYVADLTVNIINQQNYKESYLLCINKDIISSSCGRQVYEKHFVYQLREPFALDLSQMQASSMNLSGSIVFKNNRERNQAYSLLISEYTSSGRMADYRIITGVAQANSIVKIPIDYQMTDKDNKLMAYVVDDFANMNILVYGTELN